MAEVRGKLRGITIWMRRKLVVLFLIVLSAFIGLGARLFFIIRNNEQTYTRQVLAQQAYDSKTLPARRGRILDANGTTLALSEKVYNVVLDAHAVLYKEEYLEPTVAALVSKFGLDEEELRTYINTHQDSRYYVLKRTLPYDQISAFRDLTNSESDNYDKNIRGVWFEENYRRAYPNGSMLADVLGFTTGDGRGLYGLEEYYNDELSGVPGREYGYLDDDSNLERTTIPAQAGHSVVTTIDLGIQSILEKHVKAFGDAHENAAREADGAHNIGCIVMGVNTGEILGMASYPGFDPNDPYNEEALMGRFMVDDKGNPVRNTETWDYTYLNPDNLHALEYDLQMQQYNSLWRNYCISDSYEPGSVAKAFTIAAALEDGKLNGNEAWTCGGFLEVGGHQIYCHNTRGHGEVDVARSMEVSCNVALMRIGQTMGAETFSKFQSIFNFGLRTGIDLAGEARTQGLIYSVEKLGPSELATNTFGQGYNATMIEMISGFCSLINGGYYYEPHIVRRIVSEGGATVKSMEPRVLKQTVSQSTSDKIRSYCRQVVTGPQGSGKPARPAGYMIGGKTGTAETLPRSQHKWYVVSFMSFAPADNPEIALYVVVDRPNDVKQDNSGLAMGIVRSILTELLPYLGYPMTEELTEEEQVEVDNLMDEIAPPLPPLPGEIGVAGDGQSAEAEIPEGVSLPEQESGEAQAGEAQQGETQQGGAQSAETQQGETQTGEEAQQGGAQQGETPAGDAPQGEAQAGGADGTGTSEESPLNESLLPAQSQTAPQETNETPAQETGQQEPAAQETAPQETAPQETGAAPDDAQQQETPQEETAPAAQEGDGQ